jgi:transcriptional regulator with XRE-family HTH domain
MAARAPGGRALNDARQAFGLTLRTRREHIGISLQNIAESTKISVAMLSGLERGDVSRWPKGIFRRSFFREYAVAIGLSPEPLLNDFVRLFPDDGAVAPSAERPAEFRLELAARDSSTGVPVKRVAVVLGELAAIGMIGLAGAWAVAVDTLPAIGLTALAYYPLSNLCVDRRMGLRSLHALARSPLPAARPETRPYEDVEGHEELQVSF